MKKPGPDAREIDLLQLGEQLRATAKILSAIAEPERLKEVVAAIRSGSHDAFHAAALDLAPPLPQFERPVCFTTLQAIQSFIGTIAIIRQWYWTANNPFGMPPNTLIDTTSSANPDDREKEELYQTYVSQGWASVAIRFDLLREPLPVTQLQVACLAPRR